jgi:hypothetical protein
VRHAAPDPARLGAPLQRGRDRRAVGPPRAGAGAAPVGRSLSAEQEAALARWVEQGPDLGRDGVVRWRCRDLRDRIGLAFGVRFHERPIGKLPTRLRFRRLSVRPRHPQSEPAAQEAFKGASLNW